MLTFASVEYAVSQIPTYPCGMNGFLICTKAKAEAKAGDKGFDPFWTIQSFCASHPHSPVRLLALLALQ